MEQKYSDAFKAGLKFGLVIAVIYIIVALINVGISLTPAMKSYQDSLAQYNKELFNQTYYSSYSSGMPYAYSHPMPQPPFEYYINLAIGLLVYAVMLLGLLIAGAYAMKKGGQAKYSLKDTAFMGGLAGLGSFVDIFIAVIVMSAVSYIFNSSSINALTSILPAGFSSIFAAIVVVELFCCCLPIGIILAVIIACIGAGAYVLLTGRLESRSAPAA